MHHLSEHINQDIAMIRTQQSIKLNTGAKEIQQLNLDVFYLFLYYPILRKTIPLSIHTARALVHLNVHSCTFQTLQTYQKLHLLIC